MLKDVDRDVLIGIAEANLSQRNSFEVIFHAAGYHYFNEAISTRETTQLFKTDQALLIISDSLAGPAELREARSAFRGPIIYAGSASDEPAITRAYQLGADYYWEKNGPYSGKVLVAYAEALMRHSSHIPRVIKNDGLSIEFVSQLVTVNDQRVALTKTEFGILSHLAIHRGRVRLYDDIVEAVWGQADFYCRNLLKTHIFNIRSKIEDDPQNPHFIQNERGFGYKMPDYSKTKE